ncbi:arylsulfatase B-like [Lineus longissimus]|uniref:arylsulfatase B-like n=1 Tax=Lineus longissimus TaxID=88925 RepID=UPI00315D603D
MENPPNAQRALLDDEKVRNVSTKHHYDVKPSYLNRNAWRNVKKKLRTRKMLLIITGVVIAIFVLIILVHALNRPHNHVIKPPEPKQVKLEINQAKQRPHIVFIVGDDYGWNDVSWHNKDMVTPNLEQLAETGVVLDKYYAYPTCTPSRAASLTGYYAHRMGLHHRVIEEFQTKHVPTNIPMISEVLREEGYATHAVGKWHLGHCSSNYTPTHRGFDSFFGYRFSTGDYYTHIHHGFYELWQNDEPYFDTAKTYSTDLYSARAVSITKAHAQEHGNGKPMFLYLAFQNVHGPQEDPPVRYHVNSSTNIPNRRVITNSAHAMDQAVGHLVDTLKQTGLYENTLIVFVSDNGGEISNGGNNLPFRGGKFTAWEGGTHVPAFIHSPLLANPGRVYRGLFHVVDWFPTLLSAIGIRHHKMGYDGIDLWEPIRTGRTSRPERYTFMYEFDPKRTAAIRVGKYKLIQGNPVDSTYAWSIRQGPEPHGDPNCWMKPDEYFRTQKCDTIVSDTMLFDIEADPEEKFDLARLLPDVVEKLKTRIGKEKARAVKLQDETGHRNKAMKFVKDHIMYPGWC